MTILLYDLVGEDEGRPFSPHCWKAMMSLAHKGLDYRRVPTVFTSVPDIEGGFSKTVPVIRDGDRLVTDSFAIALYLEKNYPDRPSLFGGKAGEAIARFFDCWSLAVLRPFLGAALLIDIHDRLAPDDRAYFRESREKRFGNPLETVAAMREAGLEAFRASLEPLRATLAHQQFLGGAAPLYPDYIVFGSFQWARVISPFKVLEEADPVFDWFQRMLDLHGGLGRSVVAA